MKFTVMGPDGKEKLRTFDANCIYDLPTLRSLSAAGYTFQLGGAAANADEVEAAVSGERTIVVEREVLIQTKANNAVTLNEERADTALVDGDTYNVSFKLCRRAKAYDSVETKSKDGFNTYTDAESFIREKAAKSKNYFAGGDVRSNETDEVLFTLVPVQG